MAETLAKASKFSYLGLNERLRRPVISIQVQQYHPLENWYKLNSNDFSLGNLDTVGRGGIIWNSCGVWASGYARAIGNTTSVVVKLWELQDEINLCIELNLANVLIELDAKLVVEMLMKYEGGQNGNDVIADCKKGL